MVTKNDSRIGKWYIHANFDIVTEDKSWIYRFDRELKTQSTVWEFPKEEPPTKIKLARSVGSKLIAFFSVSCHVATITLQVRRTVHSGGTLPNIYPKYLKKKSTECWFARNL